METIVASAPSRVILTGEHFVVYGAPALVVPVEVRNAVSISEGQGELRVEMESRLGTASAYPDGSFLGSRIMRPYAQIVARACKKAALPRPLIAWFDIKSPRGMGASTSLALAFAAALYSALGLVPGNDELFACAQESDRLAHGKAPSGMDAKAILEGPVKVRKGFAPLRFEFKPMAAELPHGTTLLFVDTAKGEWSTRTTMYAKFAASHGINKKPEELSAQERERIVLPFLSVYDSIVAELKKDGDAEALGSALRDNHELLKNAGLSTPEIEEVIETARANGSLGEKITGKGGVGGSVLILTETGNRRKLAEAVQKKGFRVLEAPISQGGVELK
ncbi:MAG: hypothetical protein QXG98_03250 [Candidatus Micrarchaeia archaeon]